MIVKDLLVALIDLESLLVKGGSVYKKASLLLEKEATQETIDEIKNFLDNYWKRG